MSRILEHYMRKDVKDAIVDFCRGREVSVATVSGGHMKRPMVIKYPRDVEELVKKGGISFHCSVEHWSNPLMINTGMSRDETNRLRCGWDLIVDIDSMMGIDAAKKAVLRVAEFLGRYGVTPTVKFSGSRGFHMGVPFSAFPKMVDYEDTSSQFPKIPRAILLFIKESIREDLMADLIEMKGGLQNLLTELEDSEGVDQSDPYIFVDIESNWGSRHLFRVPYSINEKSGLVSIPLPIDELESFSMEDAKPHRVRMGEPFLSGDGDMTDLTLTALDWFASQQKKEAKPTGRKINFKKRVPEARFPPCMKAILEGLSDGRKRAILVLANFLRSMNWTDEEISERIRKWNSDNPKPLPDNYINTQLKWFERQDRMLPPNCDNEQFMLGIGVCNPDSICKQGTNKIQIKNPAVYPFKKKVK